MIIDSSEAPRLQPPPTDGAAGAWSERGLG